MKTLKPEFEQMLAELALMAGGEVVEGLAECLKATGPSCSLRVNVAKGVRPANDERRPVAWCAEGFYIDGDRPQFTFDPALHQGLYYVQDASSMALTEVIRKIAGESREPLVYVDACAAPGGKTTAALGCLPPGSVVIANEFDRSRCGVLAENVAKWGATGVIVSNCDTSRLAQLGGLADIVAVDAPCSGEGMMRKDDDAVAQWTSRLTRNCSSLQKEIVANAWNALRPGGCLVYSTCTFNTLENEGVVEWAVAELGAEVHPTGLERYAGVSGQIGSDHHAARFIPGRVDGEGLFMALMRKPSDAPAAPALKPAKVKPLKLPQVESWLRSGFVLAELAPGIVSALPQDSAALIAAVASKLKAVYVATEVASLKGRDYVPSQQLALAPEVLRREAFPQVEVDYATAMLYLQGQAIQLSGGVPRGFVLLTYGARPLGFVKNLGNRANNLYPRRWAVRSSYVPPTAPRIL